MKTVIRMMMMMLTMMLWTVFALQVSNVVEKIFQCKLLILTSVAVGSYRTYQNIELKTLY